MAYLLHELLAEAAAATPDHEAVRCVGPLPHLWGAGRAADAVARALIAGGGQPARPGRDPPPQARGDHRGRLRDHEGRGRLRAARSQAPARRRRIVAADCSVKAVVTTSARARGCSRPSPMEGHRPGMVLLVDDGPPGDAAARGLRAIAYEDVVALRRHRPPRVGGIESRPGLHPVHVRLHRHAEGRDAHPPQRPHLRRVVRASASASARTTGVSNHAPLHFDLSMFDLYLAALGGATLVLVPEEEAYFGAALGRLIEEERITVWYSVPSALMMLTRIEPGPRARFDPCGPSCSPARCIRPGISGSFAGARPGRRALEPVRPHRDQRVHVLPGATTCRTTTGPSPSAGPARTRRCSPSRETARWRAWARRGSCTSAGQR